MKSLGKSLLFSLLLTIGITAYLNLDQLESKQADVEAIDVAAGNVAIEDPSSPDPQVHCYSVASADELDIRTRVDFEARTSKGWIPSPTHGSDAQFCLIESDMAVKKRLSEQGGS